MKPKTLITLAALLVMLPLFSTALQAQEQMLFRVNVPFKFIAGGVHMSPGEYLAFHSTPTIIRLVREDGRATAWIPVKPSPVASEGITNQVVFNRYGETYFLAQVKTGNDRQVHECFKCRGEQTLAAQYRASEVKTVALNAEAK
ncbi:MAG TPA: hypothetical protein VMT28_15145 [Terriglobales bacterium]|jgi:hypothetical protein|nr:hypothetical protein [Terriglobales bacterium]